jgi:hypothetical protein
MAMALVSTSRCEAQCCCASNPAAIDGLLAASMGGKSDEHYEERAASARGLIAVSWARASGTSEMCQSSHASMSMAWWQGQWRDLPRTQWSARTVRGHSGVPGLHRCVGEEPSGPHPPASMRCERRAHSKVRRHEATNTQLKRAGFGASAGPLQSMVNRCWIACPGVTGASKEKCSARPAASQPTKDEEADGHQVLVSGSCTGPRCRM